MQVTSSFYVAIQGACRLYGILGVDSAEQRTFNDVEIHFLQVITNVLAVAGERAQPDAVLDQRVEARTREIEQRLVAAAQDKAVLEERQRLARDLHDSVTQSLYSITLHATAAQRLLIAGDIASTASNLRELQDRAQEALDEMRLLIFELRPPVLEQVGLVAALQSRLNAVEGRANLKTALLVDGLGSLPSFAEEALYRISQEALNNALRHAHAHHITVRLRQVTSSVMLEIVDDGVGFDVATAQEAGGQGLRGIAERVTQLGGRLIVRSAPGTGTELRVEFVV
jgi:signal transduction histidine kinase